MRKNSIDIYTVLLIAVLTALSGLLSFVVSPVQNKPIKIAPQGIYAEDDTAKTSELNISHDKYANKTGVVPGSTFIGIVEPNSKNCEYVNQVKYNLKSVNLTATPGNNQLKFHIKREKTKGIYHYADKVSSENIDGYTVNSGIVLVYINNNLVGAQNYNFEQEDSNLDFWHNTKNVNLEWNKNYEVKLVLAFRYMTVYAITTVPTWCYKGIATTTIRFNDTIAPTGELSGVTNGGETNTNVTFSWGDSRATAHWSWDNSNYTNKKLEIDNGKEGNHTIVLTDQVGLSNIYTFKIDKTATVSNF
ncbi:MAG: hypothetical protein IJ295_02240 [Clostridia bacterium]|nr:hypothetical protein [Clostridia bacterium]